MAEIEQAFMLEDATIEIAGSIVGGVRNVTCNSESDNKVLHEAGSKKPREIMNGQMKFSGDVERLYLNSESIKVAWDPVNGDHPYFDIVGVTKNKNPARKITIRGCKFKNLNFTLALNTETLFNQSFDALDVDPS